MTRPLIGVTMSRRSAWRIFPLMALNLWLAGARAACWVRADQIDLKAADGVIIGGGDDIGPELYGGQLGISVRLDRARDEMELATAQQALADNIPVLGICRGAQMLNVALGGTLDQNAWQTFGMENRIRTVLPKRAVRLVGDSRLARICGPQEMRVNALHSQAIDTLGRGLAVAAHDLHGMVQAVERVRDPFAVGVQWHPEHLFYARRQRALFRALATAAKAYQRGRTQVNQVDQAHQPIPS